MQNEKHIQLLNNVKERLLILSPTVKAGLERECNKGDFYREGDKCIGKGGFGEVWKVVHKKTNQTYVIKVIDKKSIKNQQLVGQMNREIEIMYQVHHPHLMQLINHFEDDDKFFMVMPFAAKGQLYTLLRRQVRFDQRTAAQYMRETIAAVKYLHEHKIIHRDIKPENLLLDQNYRVKLSDFGWSNFKEDEDTRKTYCGTPEYLAPEMVKKQPHDYSIDIWSLGVLLFEFLAGYAPFTGANHTELFTNIKRLKINWPVDFPPLAKNLVTRILKLNPKERPSLDEISAHSWFDQNPPFRPVLVNTLIDPKEILESHLINVTPEMVKIEIDSVMSGNPKVKTSINQQRLAGNPDEYNELATMNSMLKNENDILKKEIIELRNKVGQFDAENKSLKNEINNLKDTVISGNNSQINQLTEEVQKYKILNNERLALLSEIEEKNNKIIDINSKYRKMEVEKDEIGRENKNNVSKLKELNTKLEERDDKIFKLETKINELQREKIELNEKYQQRLKDIQDKLCENVNEKNGEDYLIKLIQLLIESVNDFKLNFGRRIDLFQDFKDCYQRSENSIKELLEKKSEEVMNLINLYKKTIPEEFSNSLKKIEEQPPNKAKEIIEWYKKQNSELIEYKSKSFQYQGKVTQLENENTNIKNQMEIALKEKKLALSNEKIKSDMIDKLNDEIEQLESKIQDIILFVIENSKSKPEQFFSEFKARFNSKNSK